MKERTNKAINDGDVNNRRQRKLEVRLFLIFQLLLVN